MSAQSTGYFWHGSYINDYYDWWYHGYQVHLAPVDVNYVTALSWVGAESLAGAFCLALSIPAAPALAIGAGITVLVLTAYWAATNNDGSIDVYSLDKNRNDHDPIYPGDYVGQFRTGTGLTWDIYWPPDAPVISY